MAAPESSKYITLAEDATCIDVLAQFFRIVLTAGIALAIVLILATMAINPLHWRQQMKGQTRDFMIATVFGGLAVASLYMLFLRTDEWLETISRIRLIVRFTAKTLCRGVSWTSFDDIRGFALKILGVAARHKLAGNHYPSS